MKSSLGWSFCPRTYNIVAEGSSVFELIRSNDVKGLQELFTEMKASPFDCDECGFTPLHVSIKFQSSERNLSTESASTLLHIAITMCVIS